MDAPGSCTANAVPTRCLAIQLPSSSQLLWHITAGGHMSETGNIRLREEEDELIQLIAAGDSEAFACLYSRLHRAVFA